MLAKIKEKDVIDQLLDQIDFHRMAAEDLLSTPARNFLILPV